MPNWVTRLWTPSGFLVVVNAFCAVLAAAQNLVVARVLGPSALAVPAVLFSITGTVANLVDLRLGDVAAKIYVAAGTEPGALDTRRSAIQLGVIGSAGLALLLAAIAVPLALTTSGVFLDRDVAPPWVMAQGGAAAFGYFASSALFLMRMTDRFRLLGATRAVNQVLGVAALLASLAVSPDLNGYFVGVLAGNSAQAGLTLLLSSLAWRATLGSSLLTRGALSAASAFRLEARTLLAGGAFAYSKLIHRGADVLLLGMVASDHQTGLYRLARMLTDGLYLLYDALNQVQLPRFLRLLHDDRRDALLVESRKYAVSAGAAVVVLVALVLAIGPRIVDGVLPGFEGISIVIAIMVVPFFFVTGIHLWLWPTLLHLRRLGSFTAWALGGAAIQAGVVLVGGSVWAGTAVTGAIGYVSYYLLTYPAPTLAAVRAIERREP